MSPTLITPVTAIIIMISVSTFIAVIQIVTDIIVWTQCYTEGELKEDLSLLLTNFFHLNWQDFPTGPVDQKDGVILCGGQLLTES